VHPLLFEFERVDTVLKSVLVGGGREKGIVESCLEHAARRERQH